MLLFLLCFQFLGLLADPHVELLDCFPLDGQLDMRIGGVDSRTWGMAHERHANFLQDAGLHQARVEGVTKIVKTDVAQASILERRLPSALYVLNRLAIVGKDDPTGLVVLKQVLQQPGG